MKRQVLLLIALLTILLISAITRAEETMQNFAPPTQTEQKPQPQQRKMSYGEFGTKFVMQIENRIFSLFSAEKLSHGTGTGFIVSIEQDPKTGKRVAIVFTNKHVVENVPYTKRDLTLHFSGPNGTKEHTKTEVIYESLLHDFAVLQFELDDLSSELQNHLMPAILADESSPFYDFDANYLSLQGQDVVVLGNPLGTTNVTTFGEITGKQTISSEGHLILTQTPINPGNSGGPMITRQGVVVGINSAKRVGQDVDNMGFALPISKAIEEYKAWRKDPSLSQTTFIPMTIESISTSTLKTLGVKNLIEQDAPGYFSRHEGTLIVQDALPGGALQPGDKIFRFNGVECGNLFYNFRKAKFYSKSTVKVDIVRNNREIIKNIEVPITNINYRAQRNKLDLVSLSGMLLLEGTIYENYRSFADIKSRVWVGGFIESSQTNLHSGGFPPTLSVITAIRVNGEFKEIQTLRDLKNVIKELPVGTKHLELRVQMPLFVSSNDGPMAVPSMAGGPAHQKHLRTFTIPLTQALMYPALNLNAFEKQFSLREEDFESRDFNLFVAKRQAACEAKLNGEAAAAEPLIPRSEIQGPAASAGASWGFTIPNAVKSN